MASITRTNADSNQNLSGTDNWKHIRDQQQRRQRIRKALLTAATLVIVLIFLYPIYFWITASVRPFQEIFAVPPQIAITETTDAWWSVVIGGRSYADVVREQAGAAATATGGAGTSGFYVVPYLIDSIIIGLTSTFVVIVVGSITSYGLSRFHFRAKQNVAFFIISTRFMPPIAVALPLFLIYTELGWIDTYHGLILAHTVINLPIAILLMKSFFDDIPQDLDEAAMVDGATRWGAFWRVTVRLATPGIAAAAVLSMIFSWNEFLLTLYLTRFEIRTIPVAMSTFDSSSGGTQWGFLAAAGSAAMIPVFIFILFVQRHLVRGLTLGAVRG
ncbi:MAG: carbohydrate ABC transporter permease [Chloroflexi bacterium]|nr:carbohydrate ABC transporter permease [Chloroflexota bacterium]